MKGEEDFQLPPRRGMDGGEGGKGGSAELSTVPGHPVYD